MLPVLFANLVSLFEILIGRLSAPQKPIKNWEWKKNNDGVCFTTNKSNSRAQKMEAV